MGSETELTESQLGAVDELRSRFFHACEDKSFASEFDERDLERFSYDDWWVYNFFLLGRSKIDMALQKITNSFRWRKEFGVNDITEESFPIEVHQKGAVYPHGKDKEGRTILWFDVKLHNKKIPGQTEKAKRYLVYWLEKHQREYPSQRITVLEDMSGAGVANMDLEVVKFKIRCFEEYFPFLVDMLFIYEMAWILNAIWKIVEKLLSEEAKSHIKFIRKGDVKNYIDDNTLPNHMGGSDNFQWVYTPRNTEDEEYQSILYTDDVQELNGTDSDKNNDTLTNQENSSESSVDDSNKSATNILQLDNRQSLSGDASEESYASHTPQTNCVKDEQAGGNGEGSSVLANNVVSDNFQIVTPLLTDQSQRKFKQARQQNGVIQERPKKPACSVSSNLLKVQFAESEADELERKKLKEKNKGLRLIKSVKPQDSHVGPLLTIIPGEQLDFSLKSSKNDEPSTELYTRITLQNTTNNTVAFKVKTTSPDRYRVKPSAGPIKPNANVNISVYINTSHKDAIAKDKFLVMSTELKEVIKSPAEMTEFWKRVSKEDTMEHRLRCAYVPTEEEKEKFQEGPNTALEKQITQLNEKISTLTDLATRQHDSLHKKLNLVLILIFIALLVMMYLIFSLPSSNIEGTACSAHNHMYTERVTNS